MQNIATEYDYYTLEQAREIIRQEERQEKANKAYFIKQKLLGLFALSVSACEILAGYAGMIDEGGAFIFLLPIGIYALVTKNKICNF